MPEHGHKPDSKSPKSDDPKGPVLDASKQTLAVGDNVNIPAVVKSLSGDKVTVTTRQHHPGDKEGEEVTLLACCVEKQ